MMKTKAILFLACILGAFSLVSKASTSVSILKSNSIKSNQLIINNLDSLIFDLANATLTANYIDVPLYISSDDAITSFNYALKFNLSKLTFSATIDLLPSDATILSSSFFNTNDLFLRYTGSSLQGYPANNGVYVTKIRFSLNTPCTPLSNADFTDILAILNGTQCSYRMTNLNFGKFVPLAAFNTGPSCLNKSTQFTDVSSIGNGTITSWLWNFDNGSTSTSQNPATTFTSTGSVSSTLIVTANSGCKDTAVASFSINILPVSSFSYVVDCVKDSVFFTNTSTIASGTIAGSNWDFGDSQGSSTVNNPGHHYNASTFYTVTLLSTSNFSCTSTSSLVINLTNKVSANFTINSNSKCIGSEIKFTDISTYSLNVINAWAWDFGNGNISSIQNPITTYSAAGNYSVLLTSTSADGCKGFIKQTIRIGAPPKVQFGVSTVTACALATASFTDLSTSQPGSTFLWNFGNGTFSSLQNPVYTYSNAGVYQVKFVILTVDGCSDSLTAPYNVILPSQVPAPFSYSVIANTEVLFSNLNNNVTSVLWDFGDSQNSVLNSPLHSFPEVNTYQVCLTTVNLSGCVSSSCQDVFVGLSRLVAVPSAFTPNKDNTNDLLKVKGGPFVQIEFQIFNEWGNLLFSSNSQETGWDGRFNGELQPAGVYEYILNAITLDNKTISLYGAVNLIR
jgi:gliding motility-associated-like protein